MVWPSDGHGVTHGWGDLELQPRDMAKIGALWLNEGRWDGKQIVPAAYLRAATAIHSENAEGEGYGYGFWVHPGVAGGMFEATGRGGQRITVLPSRNVVLAITGGGFDPGAIAQFLFDAIKSDGGALPENPAAAATLRAAIAAAGEAPHADRQSAVSAAPDIVRKISGKRYEVQVNPWNLRAFRFRFPSGGAAPVLQLSFSDSHSELVKIGMHGSPILSPVGAHRALVSGSFDGPDTLVVDYNQIGRINDIELRCRFTADGVAIQLFEKTERARFELSGRQQP